MFYQGYLFPFIDYGSLTWGSAAGTHTEHLSKLQKRAARIILHAEFNTPSDTMFRELGWFLVPNRINFNKAVFTYRALNDLTPEYLSTLLKPVSQVHTLNLRSTDNGSLYVPKSRTYGSLYVTLCFVLCHFDFVVLTIHFCILCTMLHI